MVILGNNKVGKSELLFQIAQTITKRNDVGNIPFDFLHDYSEGHTDLLGVDSSLQGYINLRIDNLFESIKRSLGVHEHKLTIYCRRINFGDLGVYSGPLTGMYWLNHVDVVLQLKRIEGMYRGNVHRHFERDIRTNNGAGTVANYLAGRTMTVWIRNVKNGAVFFSKKGEFVI